MSTQAPWIALAIDWMESDMLDDSTMGVRLAWVCLLCHVKGKGRKGSAKMNRKAFQRHYELSERSVREMLDRAHKCGAAHIKGDVVTLCNWDTYQWVSGKKARPKVGDCGENPATHHTSHITEDSTPQPPKGFARWWKIYPNRTDKAKALAYWTGRKPLADGTKQGLEPVAEEICEAVAAQVAHRKRRQSAGKFVPEWKGAATWIYNGCWKDEIPADPGKAASDAADRERADWRRRMDEDRAKAMTPEERKALAAELRPFNRGGKS